MELMWMDYSRKVWMWVELNRNKMKEKEKDDKLLWDKVKE